MMQELQQPNRIPIKMNEEGYGEIEVDFGYIGDYMRKASMIAVTEGIPIQFKFNEKIYRITPEEAKLLWTPDNIKKSIDSSRGVVRNHQARIAEEEGEIDDLKKLGQLLYGEEFSDGIKDL